MSLNKELNKLSNSLTSNRYSIKTKTPNNTHFSKYISRQNTLENEKDLIYKRIKKTKKIKNNFPLLKKYDSSSSLLNSSSKKNVNSISVQDRRNLKKINKENSIELNKKNSCLTRNSSTKTAVCFPESLVRISAYSSRISLVTQRVFLPSTTDNQTSW